MEAQFNPAMLVLVREYLGKTQAQVAAAAGVTQGYISKSENGLIFPANEVISRIAVALNWPAEFFYRTDRVYGFGTSCMYHRKQASLKVSVLTTAQATANILRMAVAPLFEELVVKHPNELVRLDIDEHGGSPENIAQMVRASWHLPLGPIKNMFTTIEAAGGVIYEIPFGTHRLEAVSHWPPGSFAIFLVNADSPPDRIRWSLAHELGHVVMHSIPTDAMETEADRFAAEFLMPEREIRPSLDRLDLKRAAQLKAYWRVSMQALIRRARDLSCIPPSRAVRLFAELSGLGYRTNEPVEIPRETPTVLRAALATHRREHNYSLQDLAAMSGMPEEEFERLHPMERPALRLVR